MTLLKQLSAQAAARGMTFLGFWVVSIRALVSDPSCEELFPKHDGRTGSLPPGGCEGLFFDSYIHSLHSATDPLQYQDVLNQSLESRELYFLEL